MLSIYIHIFKKSYRIPARCSNICNVFLISNCVSYHIYTHIQSTLIITSKDQKIEFEIYNIIYD